MVRLPSEWVAVERMGIEICCVFLSSVGGGGSSGKSCNRVSSQEMKGKYQPRVDESKRDRAGIINRANCAVGSDRPKAFEILAGDRRKVAKVKLRIPIGNVCPKIAQVRG